MPGSVPAAMRGRAARCGSSGADPHPGVSNAHARARDKTKSQHFKPVHGLRNRPPPLVALFEGERALKKRSLLYPKDREGCTGDGETQCFQRLDLHIGVLVVVQVKTNGIKVLTRPK